MKNTHRGIFICKKQFRVAIIIGFLGTLLLLRLDSAPVYASPWPGDTGGNDFHPQEVTWYVKVHTFEGIHNQATHQYHFIGNWRQPIVLTDDNVNTGVIHWRDWHVEVRAKYDQHTRQAQENATFTAKVQAQGGHYYNTVVELTTSGSIDVDPWLIDIVPFTTVNTLCMMNRDTEDSAQVFHTCVLSPPVLASRYAFTQDERIALWKEEDEYTQQQKK